jgi:hypothetical protein
MSIPLKTEAVTVAHANSDKNNQIFIAAEAIWGIKPDKLPKAKFDELKTVLTGNLTREYGPFKVQSKPLSSGNVFIIYMDPEVLESSYKKSPCSLDTCMVTNATFKCARCHKAMYCSKDHQKQDWSRHKFQCISEK